MLRIRRVEIDQFRSIKQLAFEPGMLCAIVGANNAGKSNILGALDLLLGHRFPTQPALYDEDFYGMNLEAELRIRAVFAYDEEGFAEEEMIIEFGPESGQPELKLRGWGPGLRNGQWLNRGTRERFPLIRLGVDRGLRQHEPRNRWTLLGRLLLEINEEFKTDAKRMEEFTQALTHLRDDLLGSVPQFEELLSVLRAESATQLHRSIEDVNVELSLHDPWNFYRTLQIVVRESGMQLRAEQMGMGLQSSLAIALLRAYARIARSGRAVIAIEEPELFMHPLAERQFYAVMRDLAYPPEESGRQPLQILYTTHSGRMVSFEHFDEIVLARKHCDEDGEWSTTVHQGNVATLVTEVRTEVPEATAESVRARLATAYDQSQTEGVFATAVVVVEGASEASALPIYAAALGTNLDALNIAVVNAHGKTQIPNLLRVYAQFGIPCFAVFDGDAHRAGADQHVDANRRILECCGALAVDSPPTQVGERFASWSEDFERYLRSAVEDYESLEAAGRAELGSSKPIIARYCAQQLAITGRIPPGIVDLIAGIAKMVNFDSAPGEDAAARPNPFMAAEPESGESQIPF